MATSTSTSSNIIISMIATTAFVATVHAVLAGMIYNKKNTDDQQKENTCCNCGCVNDKKRSDAVVVTLPSWADKFTESYKNKTFTSESEMMKVAIDIADKNIDEKTGGPFGTAIYECDTTTGKCKLFCIGMNQVVSLNNSTLHGEMIAIQFGQRKLNSFTFGASRKSGKEYHLYTSCEPCCQCLGGTLWSGVSKLVCAASKVDAELIGFDEGPVFPESYDALEAAGVKVVRNVLREEGAKVLKRYAETGVIYNA
jgi:tRNA(Arg) A34 adenosine deaminase TadA